MIEVIHFQRRPHPFHFSIEKLFGEIRQGLGKSVAVKVEVCPQESVGLVARIQNAFFARRQAGAVNHITGDVHYLAIGLPSYNTILTIHDCGFLRHPNLIARFVLKLFWLSWPVKRVRVVTTISEMTKQEILQYLPSCPPEKIVVIPNFISSRFQIVPKRFNSEKPRLLQIGTKANKNIPRLLQALEGIPCELQIIGERKAELVQQLESYNIDYHWSERISEEDLLRAYEESDVVVFASTLEGFGMPILEAQTVGRPVVTSNISSMPEVAGEGACLVDPYDIQSIREGILKVITDETYRKDILTKGFENVKRFSVESVAQQYADLYDEVYTEGNNQKK